MDSDIYSKLEQMSESHWQANYDGRWQPMREQIGKMSFEDSHTA